MQNNKINKTSGNLKKKSKLSVYIKTLILLTSSIIAVTLITGFFTNSITIQSLYSIIVIIIDIVLLYFIFKPVHNMKSEINKYELYKENMVSFANKLVQASEKGHVTAGTEHESKQIANSFNFLIKNVNQFIDELDKISEETLDVSRNLASSTNITTNNMDSVTTAVNNFSTMTDKLNENSVQISNNAAKVDNLARNGMEKIMNLENMMDSIKDDAAKATTQINELHAAAGKIENILNIISEIANSTRMLALNASIEAARAGNTGKGFTVVAREIKNLAQDTQSSLKDISSVVKNLKEHIQRAVDTISTNNEEIINCEGLMKETSGTFGRIKNDMESMVESIAATTEVSKLIYKGREEISASTDEQMSSIKEIDGTAKKLSLMAAELKEKLADTQLGSTRVEIDLEKFDKQYSAITENQKQEIIEDLGLENKFVISVIARLEKVKGHEFLFESLESLSVNYDELVCLIIGDGSQEEKLKNLAIEKNMNHCIKFLGFRKDIQLLLSISHVTVLTSKKEGTPPRILLESMAAKKPVVATRLSGTKNIIEDNKTGFLVDYGKEKALTEKIEYFIKNPDKSDEFGISARQSLEELIDVK